MEKFRQKLAQWMRGRYGADDFSRFLLGAAVALMVLNIFLRVRLLNTLILVALFYVYFRMFSTNITARYNENTRFLDFSRKYLSGWKNLGARLQDRKANHIYRCPKCGQKIRIPRGRGRIVVTCPKCREEFEKKS